MVAVGTPLPIGEAVMAAFVSAYLGVFVARVRAVGANNYGMDLQLPEDAFRFRRYIRQRKAAGADEKS